MEKLIAAGLEALSLTGRVPSGAAGTLAEYGAALLEKNKVMNLTAIREPEDVARLHMLDCAALLNAPGFSSDPFPASDPSAPSGAAPKRLIDVGTGAGFPGLVLKILAPALEVTLLDSLQKRLDWLAELSASLGLEGVQTVHARAEELSLQPGWRESFDLATARAVAGLRVLAELCLPYVKVGGLFLAMKAMDCGDELSGAKPALERLGGRVETLWEYAIPGTDITRRVAVIRKLSPTPPGFPRKWARIQKG